MTSWLPEHWRTIVESAGVVSLVFAWTELRRNVRLQREEARSRIIEGHRELELYHDQNPELDALFEGNRDLSTRPLTDKELRHVRLRILHLGGSFYAQRSGIYVQPEGIGEDIRVFFSYPATRSAWRQMKRFHDKKFVAFVEGNLGSIHE